MIDESGYAFLGKLTMVQNALYTATGNLASVISALSDEEVLANDNAFNGMRKKAKDALNSIRIDIEWLLETYE